MNNLNQNPCARMGTQPIAPRCHEFPMRGGYCTAQVVVPGNLTKAEADRLCDFIRSLAK